MVGARADGLVLIIATPSMRSFVNSWIVVYNCDLIWEVRAKCFKCCDNCWIMINSHDLI
jgi:hypothetical protein